jgi:hypothetical protein
MCYKFHVQEVLPWLQPLSEKGITLGLVGETRAYSGFPQNVHSHQ